MEDHASPDGIHNGNDQEQTESAFNSTWQPSDAALLQPSNLGLPKVMRAWERKPLSPFSRQRLRVGKVWKRPAISTNPRTDGLDTTVDRGSTKRRKARTSMEEGLKPVKKMRLDSRFGMAASVVGWEACESPARKIVTRSTGGEGHLVALSDEEEEADVGQEEEGDVTIEILDEDGTIVEVDPENGGRDGEWEDEERLDDPERTDGTIPTSKDNRETSSTPDRSIESTLVTSHEAVSEAEEYAEKYGEERSNSPPAEAIDPPDSTEAANPVVEGAAQPVMLPAHAPNVVLPDGFVSPVKRRQAKVQKRALLSSRRKTLPIQFAPSVVADVTSTAPTIVKEHASNDIGEDVVEETMTEVAAEPVAPEVVPDIDAAETKPGEDDWEDVGSIATDDDDTMDVENLPDDTTTEQIEPCGDAMPTEQATPTHQAVQRIDDSVSTKLPSSPVPTIEGQHPRLPLRRSPRRKSTSPLKQSTILPPTERPHLIAFTPLKRRTPSSDGHDTYEVSEQIEDDRIDSTSPIERPSSAPPEEPHISSSRKPTSKPRVSDDTALLQAFLNRAAESKGSSSRRISASKRESISNRRDSDTVRQALASPAKAGDVLADLDPNSPSPRKPATSAVFSEANVFDEVIAEAVSKAEEEATQVTDDGGADSDTGTKLTRRSGRRKGKAQQQSTPAPNKISIRGNADGVVIKKTETQELAQLTRTNTRKNKGSALLPPLRLTKMVLQFGNTEVDASGLDESVSEKPDGAKAVKWAETLVEFYQGGEMEEVSVLSDELNGPSTQTLSTPRPEKDGAAAAESVASAPPPSDTPSKPKIRKLKAARTAATPGKTPTAAIAPPSDKAPTTAEAASSQSSKAKTPTTTKRRSRIATPAKGLTNAALLPPDFDPQPVVPAAPQQQPQRTKKAPVSKLPAPASASSTTSLVGHGKENSLSLISSPPKKKSSSSSGGLPSARTFAPKLDLGGKTRFEPTASTSQEESAVPGLMSPAKKGTRTRMIGFARNDGDENDRERKVDVVPGLGSPAKKRGRRMV
jgi:hypothetical protein